MVLEDNSIMRPHSHDKRYLPILSDLMVIQRINDKYLCTGKLYKMERQLWCIKLDLWGKMLLYDIELLK